MKPGIIIKNLGSVGLLANRFEAEYIDANGRSKPAGSGTLATAGDMLGHALKHVEFMAYPAPEWVIGVGKRDAKDAGLEARLRLPGAGRPAKGESEKLVPLTIYVPPATKAKVDAKKLAEEVASRF